ncbi:MAG: hypothetical protein WC799_23505 [Desulfobacteraceae bacterium]
MNHDRGGLDKVKERLNSIVLFYGCYKEFYVYDLNAVKMFEFKKVVQCLPTG